MTGPQKALRERLHDRMTFAGILSLLLLLPFAYLRHRATGEAVMSSMQAVVFAFLLTSAVLWKRLRPAVRAGILLAGLAFMALSAMSRFGLSAPGAIVIPFISIFASLAFGRRIGLWVLGGCMLAVLIIAVLFVLQVLRPAVDLSTFVRSPSVWLALMFVQTATTAWYLFTVAPIQEAERQSTTHLDAVINGLNDALFIHDKDTGAILQVNEKMCSMFGVTGAEAVNLSVADMSEGTPYDQAHAKQWIARAATEGPQLFEWRSKDRAGRSFWTEVNMRIVRMDGVDRLLAVVRDISARKQADQTLTLLKRTIDLHPHAVYWLDDQWKIVYVNRCGEEALGYAPRELLGRHLSTINPLATSESMARVTRQLREKGSFQVESTHRRKDGSEFPVQITTTYVEFEGKAYQCGFAEDITERRRRELEQRAIEARMNHTQRLEAIGTLAGGIAHDFNNILGAIIGYTDLAMMHLPEGSEARAMIAQVERGAARATELVRQILAFSRRGPQERKAVQLGPVVKEVLKLLRASLPSTIDIRENIASHDAIYADVSQVHQVIMNLCTNAGLAMRESGGVLSVSVDDIALDESLAARHPDLAPGAYCRLRVRDTGCGIPPEIRDRIFEPFFTTRAVGEGTGLGLSVVHGIVKNANGSIHVESSVGNGTTFEILFPACKSASETDSVREVVRYGNERILVVDDEPDLVDVAQRGLSNFGYKVDSFTDPWRAIEAFRARSTEYDLIVTDMTMPGMLGNTLANRARGIRPGVPVILASGYSDQFTAEKAEAAGFDGFVDKPLRPSTLAQLVRRILDARRGK